jgi:hypothetical protein
MRPPPPRNFVGVVEQIRPFAFGGPPKAPSPAPKSVYACLENKQSPMQQACQRSHEFNVRPLREFNRYRGDTRITFSGGPPRPIKRTNPKPIDRILVQTFE